MQALLALELGKELLRKGEFGQARIQLEKANSHLRRGKLRLALFGLRFAPASDGAYGPKLGKTYGVFDVNL